MDKPSGKFETTDAKNVQFNDKNTLGNFIKTPP